MPKVYQRTCQFCEQAFGATSSKSKHCSLACRIMEISRIFNGTDDCWPWPMSSNPQTGYGSVMTRKNGKNVLLAAHRASYETYHGDIPMGTHVCHTCDNRICFNPAHLFAGSAKDNMRDMLKKGRGGQAKPRKAGWVHPSIAKPECLQRGSSHHAAKINEDTALHIWHSLANESMASISRRLGVSYGSIAAIKYGVSWTSLTLQPSPRRKG